MSNPQPSPEILNAVGHAILRSIVAGQGEMLRSAADALERLERLLPTASAEGRMIAALMAISSDHPSSPVVAAPSPTSSPARPTRRSKAATPRMDASGKLISSREVNGIAVISQAEARKVLGMRCIQMLRLEDQKLLSRIQENGSRLVYYAVAEVQRLFDLVTGGRDPEPPMMAARWTKPSHGHSDGSAAADDVKAHPSPTPPLEEMCRVLELL